MASRSPMFLLLFCFPGAFAKTPMMSSYSAWSKSETNSGAPLVPLPTYTAMAEGIIEEPCDSAFQTLRDRYLNDDVGTRLILGIGIMCGPLDEKASTSWVRTDILGGPKTIDDVAFLQDYIAKHQDLDFFGIRVHFTLAAHLLAKVAVEPGQWTLDGDGEEFFTRFRWDIFWRDFDSLAAFFEYFAGIRTMAAAVDRDELLRIVATELSPWHKRLYHQRLLPISSGVHLDLELILIPGQGETRAFLSPFAAQMDCRATTTDTCALDEGASP